jgi:REP element-mobilizing transposase RayT
MLLGAAGARGLLSFKMPEIARLVSHHILQGAWVVMPNHVHMLMTPPGKVSELMRRL